jgi:hypothetical protein
VKQVLPVEFRIGRGVFVGQPVVPRDEVCEQGRCRVQLRRFVSRRALDDARDRDDEVAQADKIGHGSWSFTKPIRSRAD